VGHRHDDGHDEPLRERDERKLTEPRLQPVVEQVRDVMRGHESEEDPRPENERASATARHHVILAGLVR
jgi:hypothetical protein